VSERMNGIIESCLSAFFSIYMQHSMRDL